VARRLDLTPADLLPRTVGHVSLALALSAYEQWLSEDDTSLAMLLERSFEVFADYLSGSPSFSD